METAGNPHQVCHLQGPPGDVTQSQDWKETSQILNIINGREFSIHNLEYFVYIIRHYKISACRLQMGTYMR